ncbi:hypothetical protein [Streptomyces sp. BH105]|uniref:hypothetical protein n=1 Tax=Streptomyces sp. BH105 TaxID=3410408 RepID=UPI003CFA7338
MKLTIRGLFRPTGQHRAVSAPVFDLDDVPRDALLDDDQVEQLVADGEIEANECAPCPGCERNTFHAMHTDGSRTCWTCATTTAGEQ